MILVCKHCGKEFKTTHSCAVYCSRSCRNKANPCKFTKKHREKLSKSMMGKNAGKKNAMYGKSGELSPAFGTKRTAECRKKMSELKIKLFEERRESGEWIPAVNSPYPEEWTDELKAKIRKRDRFACDLCGLSAYDVHHIDYDKNNCNESNLITLCHSCHSKTNFNREVYQEYFEIVMDIKYGDLYE